MAALKLVALHSIFSFISISCLPFIGSAEISSSNPDAVDIQIHNGRKLFGINSPPVTDSTPAILTLNSFEKGGDGGGPSECDGKFHKNSQMIVALSTGWYARGSRCGQMIEIRAHNGRRAVAKVVDECDSRRGCRNNIVDGSDAVWRVLGLDEDLGVVPVTWSMA